MSSPDIRAVLPAHSCLVGRKVKALSTTSNKIDRGYEEIDLRLRNLVRYPAHFNSAFVLIFNGRFFDKSKPLIEIMNFKNRRSEPMEEKKNQHDDFIQIRKKKDNWQAMIVHKLRKQKRRGISERHPDPKKDKSIKSKHKKETGRGTLEQQVEQLMINTSVFILNFVITGNRS